MKFGIYNNLHLFRSRSTIGDRIVKYLIIMILTDQCVPFRSNSTKRDFYLAEYESRQCK